MSEEKRDRARSEGDSDAPLPDPRLHPIAPPEREQVAPPRMAAMKTMGGVGTLGLEVVLSILFGLFLGQWLDGRFETTPWLTLLGSSFGLAAAVRAVLRQMRKMKAEAAREEAAEGNPSPLWETGEEKKLRAAEAKRGEETR